MPALPICIYCRKPVDRDAEDYVVINKDPDRYDTPGFVAHRKCHEGANRS